MKQLIAVTSGKGGVGKSTVAVNLAAAFAKAGKRVGLIDADFYGPSVPILLGGGKISLAPGGQGILPAEAYGIKYVSIGFFLEDPDTPVIWRGPMLHKALKQLFEDVQWGEIDVGIIDMPPGTGDAQLSLSQLVKLAGAVVVTTPQEVAMSDVRKAINMLAKINVDVLGVVENMAGFTTPDGRTYNIFGCGGGERISEKFGVPLLASVPIDTGICESGDAGKPVVCEPNSAVGRTFDGLALKIMDLLATKHKNVAGLRVL